MTAPFPNYHPSILSEQLRTNNGQILHLERGLLVFADVSGFTSLTERFASCGLPAATEALQTLLSDYFDRLLSELLTHGGEAIKDPAVRQFQHILRRHGGCLRQVIIDDKGAVPSRARAPVCKHSPSKGVSNKRRERALNKPLSNTPTTWP